MYQWILNTVSVRYQHNATTGATCTLHNAVFHLSTFSQIYHFNLSINQPNPVFCPMLTLTPGESQTEL